MKVWNYESYEEYVAKQVDTNLTKYKTHSYVSQTEVQAIVDYMAKKELTPKFGLCHGSRRGNEQLYFQAIFANKNLQVEVLGTEISHTATLFPNTIQWDFNKVKGEWVNNVDFIYSNSFDHSFDPSETIDAWMSCLSNDGLCFIQWSQDNLGHRASDPIGGTLEEWKELFSKKYIVKKTFDVSSSLGVTGMVNPPQDRTIIVIENKK